MSEIINGHLTNVDSIIYKYATEFRGHVKNSLINQLKSAKVIYDCSNKLSNYSDFERFCETIGIKPKSSTMSKLKKIGQYYDLFSSHIDSLPDSWTSIYQIALLGDEEAERLLNNGIITKDTTGKDIKDINGKPERGESAQDGEEEAIEGEIIPNGNNKSQLCTVNIIEETLKDQETLHNIISLIDGLKKIGAECVINSQFKNQFI